MITAMASACINNIGMSPEKFIDCPPPKYPSSYGWLSPRFSTSLDFLSNNAPKPAKKPTHRSLSNNMKSMKVEESDPEICGNDFVDFEFCLEDPVGMLAADELFYDGKLVPLQMCSLRDSMTSAPVSVKSPEKQKVGRRNMISSTDPYLNSPKAPRCSSRWKELLGLRKLYQNSNIKPEDQKTASLLSSNTNCSHKNSTRSIKQFLHRNSKSDSSLSLPLLKEFENEPVSISARLSLSSSSSSSSSHEHSDLPRLSLDSSRPNAHRNASNLSRIKLAKHRARLSTENPTPAARTGRSTVRKAPETINVPVRGLSVDSPRLSSSGKIVFHSLERSSSSPSTFNGGPRYNKQRGMERSYSANLRVTPVLNVPVCSLRGFPLFSSQQKKENTVSSVGANRAQLNHIKNRTTNVI